MLNNIQIHGYVGRDPELQDKTGQNGDYKQVSFSVGVGRDFGDDTDWFRCIAYNKRAEVIHKFIHKGSQVVVTGRMESYKTKDDRTAWVLKVSGFDFCDRKSGSDADQSQEPAGYVPTDEDIPF